MKIDKTIKLSKIKYLILISWAMLMVSNLQASVLDKTIHVDFVNISLLEALTQIEQQANITFSFKSSDISQKKKITLQANSITIEQALQHLLAGQRVGFHAIGTQIILYKKKQAIEQEPTVKNKAPQTVNDTLWHTIIDSVQVFDTIQITIHDSVRHLIYDTVRTTVRQELNPQASKSNYTIELQYSIFKGRNTDPEITNTQTVVETVSYSNAITCLLGIKKNRLELQTGVGYGSESKEYEYSQATLLSTTIKIPSIVDYIAYDSLYYLIKPLDTVWSVNPVVRQKTIYTDSTQTDTIYEKQKTKLSVRSIDVPLFLRLNVIEKPRWNVFVGAGLVFRFVQFNESAFLNADNNPIIALQNLNPTPITCVFHGSVGISVELFRQLFVSFSPSLSYQISDAYMSENINETKPLRLGLELGLKKNIK